MHTLRWQLIATALFLCVAASPDAGAQTRLPPGVQGPATGMATRSVAKYLDLERALQDHLSKRDRSAVVQVLAEDFDVRMVDSPDGIAADDWLRHEFASASRERIVRDLSVREFDDVAIVSFLLSGAKSQGSGKTPSTLFVVDVWRQSSGKLLTRFVDRPIAPPPLPSRPTGRE